MTSSQTCVRCRRRRIKCDLKIPACTSCRTAGVECYMIDVGLKENIPRSYLQSLQRQVEELESEIKYHTELSTNPRNQTQIPESSNVSVSDAFLGKGTSVHLFEELCRLPALINATSSQPFDSNAGHTLGATTYTQLLLPTSKTELNNLLTPPIQRALLDCFFRHIQSEFPPLFSSEQERIFLQEENPFRRVGALSDEWPRIILLSIFSVSANVICRDSQPEFSFLAHVCSDKVDSILEALGKSDVGVQENSLDLVIVICISVIRELVSPGKGRIWLYLSNAARLLLNINACLSPEDLSEREAISRLGFFLSQLEALTCSHFKRPSTQYKSLRELAESSLTPEDIIFNISRLCQQPLNLSESSLPDTIPDSYQINDSGTELSLPKALIYLSLHPIITNDLSWLNSDIPACPCSISILNQILRASRLVIEQTAVLSRQSRVICIWMTMERALQAGLVWVIFLLYQVRLLAQGENFPYEISRGDSLEMLILCSSTLALLSEKWRPGISYCLAWESMQYRVLKILSLSEQVES